MNGAEGGYWGYWVSIVRLDEEPMRMTDVTHDAEMDMVKLFPPCKATMLDAKLCRETERKPEYNMSGIDWGADSSSILVMAEVPCAGSYGGIMCQVMGYELSVPSGTILKRVNARQVKAQWQRRMAWKFEIPGPPEYRTP